VNTIRLVSLLRYTHDMSIVSSATTSNSLLVPKITARTAVLSRLIPVILHIIGDIGSTLGTSHPVSTLRNIIDNIVRTLSLSLPNPFIP
jgi:hypothetical protein